ncbi:uncharacterized protein LOC108046203 [Drosophila rhopaloa]|uniref:Protein G12 n=1 Tax=Drosophila rhopaloa TaxID=1041015 RepID=A0ABM5HJE8_DRORH|nr:uncharacterized protein LOC108046203 [Drosophila rhopaloa]
MNRGYLLLLVVCAAGISHSMGFPQDKRRKMIVGVGLDPSLSMEPPAKGMPSKNSIDLSGFVALFPERRVQTIAGQYYFNDEEFKKGYSFLRSSNFTTIKQKLIQQPEILEIANYLSDQGFDVAKVVRTVAEVFTVFPVSSFEAKENLTTFEGLHGMVKKVLEIPPKDQLIAQFSNFLSNFENDGPKFSKQINDLLNSLAWQTFACDLRNNNVDLPKILETLAPYLCTCLRHVEMLNVARK